MGPKKKQEEAPAPEPTVLETDPNVIAAREAAERQKQEECKLFERNEMIARRRVEAMEAVGWRFLLAEKERRLDPAGWENRVASKGPSYVIVKLLCGNRATPQRTIRVEINGETNILLLKNAIRDEAVRFEFPDAETAFAPERQKLHYLGKEVVAEDEVHFSLKDADINAGATVHLSLHPATISNETVLPSMVN